MNSRAKDVKILKIAILPAFILAAVVGTLSILATSISDAVAINATLAAQVTTTDNTLAAHNSADLENANGG